MSSAEAAAAAAFLMLRGMFLTIILRQKLTWTRRKNPILTSYI